MASGWNLWVWLECISVFSGCCCKEVHIDILTMIINFPYSTCISSFFSSSSPTSLFIFKCFFVLCYPIIANIIYKLLLYLTCIIGRYLYWDSSEVRGSHSQQIMP